jgi:hypothetical protein
MGSLRAAREFHEGYLGEEHRGYMDQLRHLGVLASEMEGAHMFVLGAAHSHNADSLHGHDHVGAAAPSPIMSVATSRTGGSGTPCAAAEEVLMGTHPTPTRPPARTHARAAWLGSCVCVCAGELRAPPNSTTPSMPRPKTVRQAACAGLSGVQMAGRRTLPLLAQKKWRQRWI